MPMRRNVIAPLYLDDALTGIVPETLGGKGGRLFAPLGFELAT